MTKAKTQVKNNKTASKMKDETVIIDLVNEESFHGGRHKQIEMIVPKTFHIRAVGDETSSLEILLKLIEITCNLTSSELNEFSAANCSILVNKIQELTSPPGTSVPDGTKQPGGQ